MIIDNILSILYYTLTPLHPYTLTPLHPYTLTPLHPYTLHKPSYYNKSNIPSGLSRIALDNL